VRRGRTGNNPGEAFPHISSTTKTKPTEVSNIYKMSIQVGNGARRCISGFSSTVKAARSEFSMLAQQRHVTDAEGEEQKNKFWLMFQRPVAVPIVEAVPTVEESTITPEATSEMMTPLFDEEEIHTVRLNVTGVDEAVLESYTQFLKRAAAVLTPNMMGKIVPLVPSGGPLLPSECAKQQSRMLLVHELRGDAATSFLKYIQENKPPGVSLDVDNEVRWK